MDDLTSATRELWTAFSRVAELSQDPVEIAKAWRDTAPTPELLALRRVVAQVDSSELRHDVMRALSLITGRLKGVNIARNRRRAAEVEARTRTSVARVVLRFPPRRGRTIRFEQEIGIMFLLSILHSAA